MLCLQFRTQIYFFTLLVSAYGTTLTWNEHFFSGQTKEISINFLFKLKVFKTIIFFMLSNFDYVFLIKSSTNIVYTCCVETRFLFHRHRFHETNCFSKMRCRCMSSIPLLMQLLAEHLNWSSCLDELFNIVKFSISKPNGF